MKALPLAWKVCLLGKGIGKMLGKGIGKQRWRKDSYYTEVSNLRQKKKMLLICFNSTVTFIQWHTNASTPEICIEFGENFCKDHQKEL